MRRHHQSIWTNSRLSITMAAGIGLAVVLLFTMFFSAIIYFLMDDMSFADFSSTVSLSVGAILGGYICGRFRRKRGLIEGIICGAVMYTALSIAGIVANTGILDIKKLLLLMAFCAAGGVSGVNSKRPKNYRD